MKKSIQVFIAYSRKDANLLSEFRLHLSVAEQYRNIRIWYDGYLEAGTQWNLVIKNQMLKADIILLLISPDFLASENCYKELNEAISLHEKGKLKVIPIILRECLWEYTPFAKLQVLPDDGVPVSSKDKDPDSSYSKITKAIIKIADELTLDKNSLYKQVEHSEEFDNAKKSFEISISEATTFFEDSNWTEALIHFNVALRHYRQGFRMSKEELRRRINRCNLELEYESELKAGLVAFSSEDYETALFFYNNALIKKETPQLIKLMRECELKLNLPNLNSQNPINYNSSCLCSYGKDRKYCEIKLKYETIDERVAQELKGLIVESFNDGYHNFIINLINVKYIGTVGLSALLSGKKLLKDNGIIVLSQIQEKSILKVLEITQFDKIFKVFDTLDNAIEYLEQYAVLREA